MQDRASKYQAAKRALEAEVLTNQPSPRVEVEVIRLQMRGDKLTKVIFRSRLKDTRGEAEGDEDPSS